MMSPAFLKRLVALRQQRQNNSYFQQWASQDAVQANANNKWTAAPWRGNAPQVIVYDPTNGKAYPNPAAALGAGVRDFTYQVPSGMNIDWSYWDQFKQPAPPAPKPVKPVTVEDQTVTPTPEPTEEPTEEPTKEVFQMPDQAKRFADAGMFGRAKKEVEATGGVWSKGMHQQLKNDAGANNQYGGQFDYNWSGVSKQELQGVKDFAKLGKFGKAKKAVEDAGGKWTKQMEIQLRAKNKRK